MAHNTTQNDLRFLLIYNYVKSVFIIVEKKMKDTKVLSLKKNGTGMGTYEEGRLIIFPPQQRLLVVHVRTLTKKNAKNYAKKF